MAAASTPTADRRRGGRPRPWLTVLLVPLTVALLATFSACGAFTSTDEKGGGYLEAVSEVERAELEPDEHENELGGEGLACGQDAADESERDENENERNENERDENEREADENEREADENERDDNEREADENEADENEADEDE